jgi:hypothetical protein
LSSDHPTFRDIFRTIVVLCAVGVPAALAALLFSQVFA